MRESDSNNLWLFLEVLARKRNFIFTFVIVATIISIVTAMLLPKWYKANALLLPPKNITGSLEGYNNMAEAFSVTTGLNLPIMATPTDIYARMLSSRSVTERVINKLNLQDHYQSALMDETVETLLYYTTIEVTEEGLLRVAFEDKDPTLAALVANTFIEELDSQNKEIVAVRVKQARSFIDDRLEQVKNELDSSRVELERFQMTYKTVDFDQQTRLSVEQAIQLKIKLAEIETEIGLSGLSLGSENSLMIDLRRQQKIVKDQLKKLETSNSDSSFFSLPVASIPALKGKYETIYSRLKVSEALYKVLLEQSEKAKLRQYESMPTITVLDKAQVPQLKSRPQRSYIVLGTFVLALMIAVFLSMIFEFVAKLERTSPEDYNRAMGFLSAYFGWLPGVKKSKQIN